MALRVNGQHQADDQRRHHDRRPARDRACRTAAVPTVAQMTSISVPEYVIQCDSVPCGRRPRCRS